MDQEGDISLEYDSVQMGLMICSKVKERQAVRVYNVGEDIQRKIWLNCWEPEVVKCAQDLNS